MGELSGVRSATMGLVATVAIFVLAEACARVVTSVAGYDPTQTAAPQTEPIFSGSKDLGWVLRPAFSGAAEQSGHRTIDAEGYQAVDSLQVSNEGTTKVVFIGDSNTFGYGVSAESTFAEVVDERLADFETINLGVPGYSSAQGVLITRKYIPLLKPRFAIVSFNFNDRRFSLNGPDGPDAFLRSYRASQEFWLNRTIRAAEHSHGFLTLRALFRRLHLAPTPEWAAGEVDLANAVPRVSREDYKANLAAIAAFCLENGVTPVFLLLSDAPPAAHPLRAAISALLAGDSERGTEGLRAIVEADNGDVLSLHAVARIFLAAEYERTGHTDKAQEVLKFTPPGVELDGQNPIALDTEYNVAMREVADELGVSVLDAGALLDHLPHSFIDICHFDEEGHRRIGEMIARHLVEAD